MGTFGASCRIDSYGDFTDEVARIYADDEAYVGKVEAMGSHMAGNATDSLWNVIHAVGEQSEVPNVCSVVRWKVFPSDLKAGMAMAVEMVDFFHSVHDAARAIALGQVTLGDSHEKETVGADTQSSSKQQLKEADRADNDRGADVLSPPAAP